MSEQVLCAHCQKPLLTTEPRRFITHGPVTIRTGVVEGQAWVECPTCGKETRFEHGKVSLKLP